MNQMSPDQIAWNDDGLVPAVVQDPDTMQVLMMAWMDRRALQATLDTGRVTFWSRSRQELWEKGATSGNGLRLLDLASDCDGDTLLVTARPEGPACHTGTSTCWGEPGVAGFAALEGLWTVVRRRAEDRPRGSYTTTLVEGGPDVTGRKLVEEAAEVLVAAKDHATGSADDRRVAEEAADLLYHLLVALAERDIDPARMLEVLAERRRH